MKTKTPTPSRTKRGLASDVLLGASFLSLHALWGVDGLLATKTTVYSDLTCELSTFTVLTFGVPDVLDSAIFHDFNECIAYPDVNTSVSRLCNVTTGVTGSNVYDGTTCADLTFEGAALPSCGQYSSDSADCTDTFCAEATECTDTVASTLSPTVVNFLANEYNDANCTDPTGNTVILDGDNLAGHVSGGCSAPDEGGRYVMGECRTDGSYISQAFSPYDDTCSGDVWVETTGPTEFSPPVCMTVAVGGLYYGYISCTTDASTIWLGDTLAPTTAPTESKSSTAADSAAPVDDDGSRGISETASPSPVVSGSDDIGETTSSAETDEAVESNGAAQTGSDNSITVGFATALSFAVGLWVINAM